MLREKQATPHSAPMTDSAELDLALEDAGGLSALGVQNQATVRLSESFETIQALAALGILGAQWRATAQSALVMALTALSSSGTQADNPTQSFVAAVEMLAGVTEDKFLTSLTDDDCQRLVAARDKLTDLVGETENHHFSLLKDFIGSLIEKYEEKFDVAILAENPDPRAVLLGLGPMGLEAAYGDDEPEYTDVTFTEKNPNYTGIRVELGNEEHSSGCGLGAAYGDDEPEYTDVTFIKVNPNYGKR
jgi:hypothetical protein